jgi:hypothetical protein
VCGREFLTYLFCERLGGLGCVDEQEMAAFHGESFGNGGADPCDFLDQPVAIESLKRTSRAACNDTQFALIRAMHLRTGHTDTYTPWWLTEMSAGQYLYLRGNQCWYVVGLAPWRWRRQ